MKSIPIVECVPNFSVAGEHKVISAIETSISSVPGVYILDRHSDIDHNRTVITFIGSPRAVETAAFNCIKIAGELIDMNHHVGQHPRIGAADVVPIIPIQGIDMDECIQIADRLAQKVADELELPVYLYEFAAKRPERKNLENIRRGQYEVLKKEISINPDRHPDYGPTRLGKAGATVIGARLPLIAFNVYLSTNDIEVAKYIARRIRQSSGGLPHVKAIGLLVQGMAQVSMNLTNHFQTPPSKVIDGIKTITDQIGTRIDHAELVGLIPQDAIIDAGSKHLYLDIFSSRQILENRIFAVLSKPLFPDPILQTATLINQIASEMPVPAGEYAAAISAAFAAALIIKIGKISNRKSDKTIKAQADKWILSGTELMTKMSTLANDDAEAFKEWLRTKKEVKLKKQTSNNVLQINSPETSPIIEIPLKIAEKSFLIMELALDVLRKCPLSLIGDAAAAFNLANSTIQVSLTNSRLNLDLEKRRESMDKFDSMITQLEIKTGELKKQMALSLEARRQDNILAK